MLGFSSSGDYKKTIKSLERMTDLDLMSRLSYYGEMGVTALAGNTPVDTGVTAQSWSYRVIKDAVSARVEWYNTNAPYGTSVAILIQFGHGTGTGGYVSGIDYINPAMAPVFTRMADDLWKEVTK